MSSKTILVVGGAGYIGSYVNQYLHKNNYKTIILDNLSTGNSKRVHFGTFIQGEMENKELLKKIFTTHSIDAVMLFAASISVPESVSNPQKYYQNNVVNVLALLNTMNEAGVKKIIFSSSAAIFGVPMDPTIPITEDFPCAPINAYGESKLMVEKILKSYDSAYGFKSVALRYFNAAGGDPEGKINLSDLGSSNLIPTVFRRIQKNKPIYIYGTNYPTKDGSCVRDYIHIHDLAQAHQLALEDLFKTGNSSTYNLGNGQGFSVKEVLTAVEEVTNKSLEIIENKRRLGDPATLIADSTKAHDLLGWKITYPNIKEIISHAWEAIHKQPIEML
jgi:UDP-glucose 4-epimerase